MGPNQQLQITQLEITQCNNATQALVDEINSLLPQLSRSAVPLTLDSLGQLLAHQAITVLVARTTQPDGRAGPLLGMMTLVMFPIPTGMRAWIEDVVVDEAARDAGVGAALNRRALEIAQSAGARTVDLTSRPDRAAANRLYQRLGFTQRQTNVYRYEY